MTITMNFHTPGEHHNIGRSTRGNTLTTNVNTHTYFVTVDVAIERPDGTQEAEVTFFFHNSDDAARVAATFHDAADMLRIVEAKKETLWRF